MDGNASETVSRAGRAWLRWTMAAGLTALLLLAGVVTLAATVGLDRYRGAIAELASAQVGRRLELRGGLRLALAPRPGLVARDVVVHAAGGEGSPPAAIESVTVSFALLPLLRGELRLERVTLEGADLDVAALRRSDAPRPPDEAGPPGAVPPALPRLRIARSRLHLGVHGGRPRTLEITQAEAALPARGPTTLRLSGSYADLPLRIALGGGGLAALGDPGAAWPVAGDARLGGLSVTFQARLTDPRAGEGSTLDVALRGRDADALAALLEGPPPVAEGYALELRVVSREGGLTWRMQLALQGLDPSASLRRRGIDLAAGASTSDLALEAAGRWLPRHGPGRLELLGLTVAPFVLDLEPVGSDSPLRVDRLRLRPAAEAGVRLDLAGSWKDLPLRVEGTVPQPAFPGTASTPAAVALEGGIGAIAVAVEGGVVPARPLETLTLDLETRSADIVTLERLLNRPLASVSGLDARLRVRPGDGRATLAARLRIERLALAPTLEQHGLLAVTSGDLSGLTLELASWRDGAGAGGIEQVTLELESAELSLPFPRPGTRLVLQDLGARRTGGGGITAQARGALQDLPLTLQARTGALGALLTARQRPWPLEVTADLQGLQVGVTGDILDPLDRAEPALELTLRDEDASRLERLLDRPLAAAGPLRAKASLSRAGGTYRLETDLEVGRVDLGPTLAAHGLARAVPGRLEGLRVHALGRLRPGGEFRPVHSRATAERAELTLPFPRAGSRLTVSGLEAASQADGPITLRLQGDLDGAPLGVEGTLGTLATLLAGQGRVPVDLSATLGEAALTVAGRLPDLRSATGADLRLTARAPALAALEALTGVGLPGVGPVEARVDLAAEPQVLRLSGIELAVGASRVGGDLRIAGWPRPRIEGSLLAGALALDEMVGWEPPEIDLEAAAAPAATPEAESRPGASFLDWEQDPTAGRPRPPRAPSPTGPYRPVIPDTPLPVAPLQAFEAAVEITVARLLVGEDDLGRYGARVDLEGGRLAVTRLRGQGRRARLDGSLTYDVRGDTPSVDIALELQELDVGVLLRDLGITDRVAASLDARLDLAGGGGTVRALLADAQGRLAVLTGNGRMPRGLLSLWGGDLLRALIPRSGDETRINCAALGFALREGTLESQVLLLDTREVVVAGEASVDLADETVQGLFKPAPKDPSLFRVATPVTLDGRLGDPRVRTGRATAWTLGKLLVGLSNPAALVVLFSDVGAGDKDRCAAAALKLRGEEAGIGAEGFRGFLRGLQEPLR